MGPLSKFSDFLARVERWLLIGLAGLLTALILLNVVTRAMRMPLYWVDEAAIMSMIWLTFVGASLTLRRRLSVAVTIVPEMLSRRAVAWLKAGVSGVTLGFGIMLVWLIFVWLDPIAFAAMGFDVNAFVNTTFNFVYREATNTLGIPKIWVWLVMPWFSFTWTVHALANFLEDAGAALGWREAPAVVAADGT
ncbi:MAG: TRAP transporter small permease subunit [Tagaea sp.]|nr:TRAP transporter small permease subunit [Tagaea sp.]